MNITGIEVVKRNPGMAAIGVLAGEKIELTYGDSLKVNVSFDYRGLAGSATLYGAIGNRGAFGFDEILHNEASIDLPESPADFTPCERSVDIGITSDISPGTEYDLYCKIKEYPEAGMREVNDVIDIVGIPPEYVEIQDTIYHLAYIYDGDIETCIFEFPLGPEQIPFTQWGGIKIAEAMASHVEEQGSRVLELKIYEDTTPALWTNYRVEVTAAVTPQEGIAIWPVLAALPWAAIIKGTLIVIGIVIVGWVIEKLIKAVERAFFGHKPGLEDVKLTWEKEALILDIQNAEEYWERPLTPVETLEEMSEEELRAHLDKLAEEEVPPEEVPWGALVLIGGLGLGILGVGAAAALAAKPKAA